MKITPIVLKNPLRRETSTQTLLSTFPYTPIAIDNRTRINPHRIKKELFQVYAYEVPAMRQLVIKRPQKVLTTKNNLPYIKQKDS